MTTMSCMSASFDRRRSRVFTNSIQLCVSQTSRLTFPQWPVEASSFQHVIIIQYHDVIKCHPYTYVDVTQMFCFWWPTKCSFNFTITDYERLAWWARGAIRLAIYRSWVESCLSTIAQWLWASYLGKLCGPYLSALEIRAYNKALYKFAFFTYFFTFTYTCVPLSPSSITWYQSKGGDTLRLGRWL